MTDDKAVYTVKEVAEMMGVSSPTVIRRFENEAGVLIFPRPEEMHKRSFRMIRIPH